MKCLAADRPELERLQGRIRQRTRRGAPADRLQSRLQQLEQQSAARVAERSARVPVLDYPEDLPVAAHRDTILEALQQHQVVVVAGETGSGKTTQLPKLALAAGLGVCGMIGHTQPRRLAARSVANRIAEETGAPLGELVGYQTRFEERLGATSLVKVMTDGILLAETRHDPELRRYDALIIDEAHERSLNIDFLLGYLKRLLPRRPDLKVIITSATIDVERFSAHFEGAPIISVSGRTWPVDVHYLPLDSLPAADVGEDVSTEAGVLAALEQIRALERAGTGAPSTARDVLVFLPGERDIRDLNRYLRERLDWPGVEVLPLYARLTAAEQQRVFAPGGGRRIVLATNVAETSLTVPRIGYVIDPGLARISRYSFRSKLQRLPIEPVSRASADQRAGRCGRVAPGICFRLYSEEDYLSRPEFTDPEILRTNLAAVVLQMKDLDLGDPEDFPFLEAPEPRALSDGRRLLEELGALDRNGRLTAVGHDLCRLPLDPRLGRMLLAARDKRCLREMLVIVSALTLQDPRERPADKRQAADQAHADWVEPKSDFLSFVRLWEWFLAERRQQTRSGLRKLCQRRFLSWMRMHEWWALQRQLHRICSDQRWRLNDESAAPEQVHRALLPGLLSQLGVRTERGDYLGARGLHFNIFPGSGLFRQQPAWLMAAEIVETSRVFGRTLAAIDPGWVEPEARHLVRRHHEAPRWYRKQGRVLAAETVTLFGLPIVRGRLVPFDKIDLAGARELFIREGLAQGEVNTRGAFLQHNLEQVAAVRELEARERRRDLLVSDEALVALYEQRIPESIADMRSFERWRRKVEQQQPDLLHFNRDELLQMQPDATVEADFPGSLTLGDLELELSYSFAPGAADDGVTLRVPRAALPQLRPEPLEWLVPGLLEEKCQALVRGLPKRIRRALAPVPDHLAPVIPRLLEPSRYRAGSLLRALTVEIEAVHGVAVPADAWAPDELPTHLRMRVAVLDDNGHIIDSGRDLSALQAAHGEAADQDLQQRAQGLEAMGLKQWSFGPLPESLEVSEGVRAWPAVVDEGDSVALRLRTDPQLAQRETRQGVIRLLMLAQQRALRDLLRKLDGRDRIGLMYAPLGDPQAVFDQIAQVAVRRAYLGDAPLPRDEQAFVALLKAGRARLGPTLKEVADQAREVLERWHQLRQRLSELESPALRDTVDDIQRWQGRLLQPDFLVVTPDAQLPSLPRYLQAQIDRLERLQGNVERDRARIAELEAWTERLEALEALAPTPDHDWVEDCRWALEEYRVSIHAQHLGTRFPVSAKRLRKLFAEAEQQLRLG